MFPDLEKQASSQVALFYSWNFVVFVNSHKSMK